MTVRRSLVRLLLLALACAGVAGCGDHRLTVSGYARLDGADLRTGFEFPTDVRIDGEGSAGGVTGSCSIDRVGDGVDSVVVDLFGGSGGDEGLRSLTIRARSDGANTSVDARVASATYTADASCVVDLTYVDEGGSVTLDTSDCALTSGADTATLDAHLELHGCSVAD